MGVVLRLSTGLTLVINTRLSDASTISSNFPASLGTSAYYGRGLGTFLPDQSVANYPVGRIVSIIPPCGSRINGASGE
jgi:hypothetical protein